MASATPTSSSEAIVSEARAASTSTSCSETEHSSQTVVSSGVVRRNKNRGTRAPGPKASWRPVAAAGCAYLALGFLATWHAWSRGVTHTGVGTAFDPVLFYWSLGYFAHFLGDPSRWFTTTVLARPRGVNLLDNTTVPLLGALSAPITLIWGPVASANILTVLEIASAGFTAFLLARNWTGNALAGFCAGVIEIVAGNFGASAAFGHLMTLAFFVPPLLLLVANKALREKRGNPWILGVSFGLLLVIQFFISTEIFADDILLTGISLVVCLGLFWHQSLQAIKGAAKFFLAAMATSLVILAWPLWEALEGTWHVTGPAHPKLVGFGVRLRLVAFPSIAQSPQTRLFCLMDGVKHCGSVLPPGALGIPLIAAGLASMVITWHKPLARFASVMTLATFVLAMGSYPILHAHGKAHAPIPLPFIVLAHLPVLENLGPARLMKFVALFLAVVIAFAIDEVAHWKGRVNAFPNRLLSIGTALLSLAALVPIVPRWPYQQTTVACPKFFTTGGVDILAPGSVAVTYPFPSDTAFALPWNQAMLWQACSSFRFSLVGGYALEPLDASHRSTRAMGDPTFFPERHSLLARTLVPPALPGTPGAGKLSPELAQVLRKGPKSTQILRGLARELERWKVNVVLINPRFPRALDVIKMFTILLGEPPARSGGIAYWIGVQKVLG